MRWLSVLPLVLALAGTAQAAQISVSPATGLTDGQVVTVTGTGFVPNESVSVGQCVVGRSCPAYDSNWVADDSGRFSVSYVVSRCPSTQCAITAHGAAYPDAVPLSFAAGPTLPPLRVSTKPSTRISISPRTGAAVVRGTMTCTRPGLVTINAGIRELTRTPVALEGINRTVNFVCKQGTNRWRADVFAIGGSFVPGKARLDVRWEGTGSAGDFRTNGAVIKRPRRPHPARYHVALGDSLATGFASPPGGSYVQDLFAHLAPSVPGFQLVNFGCSGATTSSLIGGGSCGAGTSVSQLQAAEAFLRAHRRALRLITIDIGGNDLVACVRPGGADPACTAASLQTVRTNLATILTRLRRAAGRSVPIVTMTYFDPVLVTWFLGQPGQDQARNSVAVDSQLSDVIRSAYSRFGGHVADVNAAFQTTDFTPLSDTPWGPLPTNVDRVCRWVNVTCPVPGTSRTQPAFGDDTNVSGSHVIADTFAGVITCSPTSCAGHAPRASSASRAARGSSAP
jgi:lysophospholipase L1-like esterase